MESSPLPVGDDLIEKATVLKTLEDGLGEFYVEQKNQLLDELRDHKLPLIEAAKILKQFAAIQFITSSELSQWTALLMKGGNPPKPAAPAEPVKPQVVSESVNVVVEKPSVINEVTWGGVIVT